MLLITGVILMLSISVDTKRKVWDGGTWCGNRGRQRLVLPVFLFNVLFSWIWVPVLRPQALKLKMESVIFSTLKFPITLFCSRLSAIISFCLPFGPKGEIHLFKSFPGFQDPICNTGNQDKFKNCFFFNWINMIGTYSLWRAFLKGSDCGGRKCCFSMVRRPN